MAATMTLTVELQSVFPTVNCKQPKIDYPQDFPRCKHFQPTPLTTDKIARISEANSNWTLMTLRKEQRCL